MPDWKQIVTRRLPGLSADPVRRADIVQELSEHLQEAYEEAEKDGCTEEEAIARALETFDDWEGMVKELEAGERRQPDLLMGPLEEKSHESAHSGPLSRLLSTLGRDLRFGLRVLLRSPGFTTVILLIIALGVGVNTSIFSVINAVLLRPLPYRQPDRLVLIRTDAEGEKNMASISPPELVDLRAQGSLFQGFAGVWANPASLKTQGFMEQISHAWATSDLFPLLGVRPLLGRNFKPEEEKPDGPKVAILGYRLWRERFGGDPHVLGKIIELDDTERTIVGVLPKGFQLLMGVSSVPSRIDVWIPQYYWLHRNLRWLRVIGRLKPGVTLQQAQAELDGISAHLNGQYQVYAGAPIHFHAVPLQQDLVRDVRLPLLALAAAVGFVLLIGCANIANLLLGKARVRSKELAIRVSLGAGRGRIISQAFTENLLLALAGGVLGLALAKLGIKVLLYLQPPDFPRMDQITLDARVLAFALGVSVLTGLLFSLLPALSIFHLNVNEILKQGGRSGRGASGGGLRAALVIFEIAFSLVLLIGAGLMIRTFLHLRDVDLGFNPHHVLTARVPVSIRKFRSPVDRWRFYRNLRERLAAQPTVQSAGAVSILPLSGTDFTINYAYDAATEANWGNLSADLRVVLPGYFKTLGIQPVQGRLLNDLDQQGERAVVVVDESLAERAWPGRNPIGRQIKVDVVPGQRQPEYAEVVGVVHSVREDNLRRVERPQIYFPYWKLAQTDMAFVIRTSMEPASLAATLRETVEQMGSGAPVHTVKTMDSYLSDAMAPSRFVLFLMGIFSALALLLSTIGIYGVISYLVVQQKREIGIRIALGAARWDIVRLVAGQGLKLTLAGMAVGLFGSLALTRLVSSLLFGISPNDPLTFVSILLVLGTTALLASLLPARRASRVDPLQALN